MNSRKGEDIPIWRRKLWMNSKKGEDTPIWKRRVLDELKTRRGYSHLKEEGTGWTQDKEMILPFERGGYWMNSRKGEDTPIWKRRVLDELKERRGYSHLKGEATGWTQGKERILPFEGGSSGWNHGKERILPFEGRSYWMNSRKGEDTPIWRRKLWIALCGELALEEALYLS
jgi:hypothetical protein